MKSRTFLKLIILPLVLLPFSCHSGQQRSWFRSAIAIPARGNSWVVNEPSKNETIISDSGIVNWSDTGMVIRTWFRTDKTGNLRVALRAKTNGTKSVLECIAGGKAIKTRINLTGYDTIDAGEFIIRKTGYNSIDLKGLEKAGKTFADITDILVSGECTQGKIWFVRDDFYWGRRGPSVHLRYDIPASAGDIKWFYSEITVPEGNDVEGSYFMANGFTDGYFGIQVNSPAERRILFSVWSPYKTDNPGEIPEDYRIKLLAKGDSVHAGEFGNEGSGGQSYMRYMWKAGVTYGFLLRGEPAENNSTDYTAWFFAPEKGKWQLIAGFRRPKGRRYLGNLYSFLENFNPGTGDITRKGYYSNQWIGNRNGKWTELVSAKFTADATARKESRLDYSGGISGGSFFLENDGFFDIPAPIGTVFQRDPNGKPPASVDILPGK